MTAKPREATVLQALTPVVLLIVLLIGSVLLFGDDAIGGSNQMSLVVATAIACLVAARNGYKWEALLEAINHGISMSLTAIVILLSVGALIGVWILSGTVPAMIYYGLGWLDPDWFLVTSCVICAVVSVVVGSSWATAGTIGVGLMGVAATLGLPLEVAAGAIISGAYFGDKLSPLSDTTNLAPSVAGSELFEHIRHLLWTTIPAFVICVVIFAFMGSGGEVSQLDELAVVRDSLNQQFHINVLLLLPLPILLFMIGRGTPSLPAIWFGILLGAILALTLQADNAAALAASEDLGYIATVFKGVWQSLFAGYEAQTGNAVLDDLLSKGGMASMLNTVWLIVCAMAFGGVMEKTGLLQKLVELILAVATGARSLLASTVVSAGITNIITAEQYMAIVLPGRMFRGAYERLNLHPVNLSRALEDGGTVTSPLVPWNSCGAYMAATLGVATMSYAPFALFCLLNPLIALFYAWRLIGVRELESNIAPR